MANAIILRPLEVPQPESLWMIERERGNGYELYPDYVDLRDRNHSFDGLAAYNVDLAGMDDGVGNASRTWFEEVSGNYFDVLRLQPYLGRFFHASDEHGPNSAPYLVLSYSYWQNHFQSDSAVIGLRVLLSKHPFTIIGVAPPWFHGTLLFFAPDFFLPIVNQSQNIEREYPECARQPDSNLRCYRTFETGSDAGASDRRFELDWRVSGKDLSQRRRPREFWIGPAESVRQLPGPRRLVRSLRD